ncbi:MAG: TetR family transcriptional regulator [Balneolaceae bacterium]|nr:TetR family transcriptional regulator [Balneolaceae bacterium]MCH8549399.1 TetR/AcrR family transcriptional regulator [Balneolaceae bacterium]
MTKNHSPRKKQFLDESLKMIHEKGYKATTMRDLAERMGFEVSNIYNFIDSKEALLESYLFMISEDFHDGIDHILESGYPPTEKLKALVSLNIRLTSTKPYQVGLLVNEWRNLKEPKLTKFIDRRNEYEEKVRLIISEGIESGEFRPFDMDIITHAVLSSVKWIYYWYTDHSEEVNPVELERQLTEFVLGGVGGGAQS